MMICRHLVGASLDEEGLEDLRRKVREKEEDCRRYREHTANVGRRRQLELAKETDTGMDVEMALELEKEMEEERMGGSKEANSDEGKKKPEYTTENHGRKAVTFKSSCGGRKINTNSHDSKKSVTGKANDPPNELIDGMPGASASENNPSVTCNDGDEIDLMTNANTAPNGNVEVGESTLASSSSLQKRTTPSGDAEMKIPRKKKRVSFGSLLPLVPPPTQPAKKNEVQPGNSALTEEVELEDPSDERDQLRNKLEEAEKLEIAAVELRRKLFGSRIVSRTDVGDLGKDVKSLKRVFPCGGVMVRNHRIVECIY